MMLFVGLFAVVVLLTVAAIVVYDRTRSRRSEAFEQYKDEHMETITEQRIRRNLNQGG